MNMGLLPTHDQKFNAVAAHYEAYLQQAEELEAHGMEATAQLMRLEIKGGPCPRCGKAWKNQTYDNHFGLGSYYKPDCHCYMYCPRCKRDLYLDEVVHKHLDVCSYCSYPLTREKQKESMETLGEKDKKIMEKYYNQFPVRVIPRERIVL